MKRITIQIDERIEIVISPTEYIIVIKGYSEDCIMTINYPENWAISRAIQHAMSIATVSMLSNQIA